MEGTCTRSDVHTYRRAYTSRKHTHEKITKQKNIHTEETTRRGLQTKRILYKRDMYMEETYTQDLESFFKSYDPGGGGGGGEYR